MCRSQAKEYIKIHTITMSEKLLKGKQKKSYISFYSSNYIQTQSSFSPLFFIFLGNPDDIKMNENQLILKLSLQSIGREVSK